MYRRIVALVAGVVGLALSAPAPAAAQQDPLPPRHAVRNGVLEVGWPDLAGIEVSSEFRYLGAQRFILRGVVDAEQHAFVISDSTGLVTRLLWIQIEHFLPAASGTYDYGADSLVSIQGRSLRQNVRRYSAPPDSSSDRGALYALLRRMGQNPPAIAERVRWVHVTADRRSEVMIIHAEMLSAPDMSIPRDTSAAIMRARPAFALLPRTGS